MIHTQAYNIDCITTGEHFKHGGRCCLSNMPPAGHTVLASAPALFGACDYGRLLVHLHLNLSHVCHSTMYVRSLNMAQPSACRVAPACMCEGIQLCLQLPLSTPLTSRRHGRHVSVLASWSVLGLSRTTTHTWKEHQRC